MEGSLSFYAHVILLSIITWSVLRLSLSPPPDPSLSPSLSVLLHVGPHKTGSSSFQVDLNNVLKQYRERGRESERQDGRCWVGGGSVGVWDNSVVHTWLREQEREGVSEAAGIAHEKLVNETVLRVWREEVRRCECSVVVSAETLETLTPALFAAFLAELDSDRCPRRPSVLFVYRSTAHALLSNWEEATKMMSIAGPGGAVRTATDALSASLLAAGSPRTTYSDTGSYDATLSWLSDVVGGESVHLVSFEGLIGSHISLLEYAQAHFLRLGGSPTLPPWLNYTASHANPSADAAVYATAVYLRNEVSRRGCRSRTGKPRGHDQALRALAASLSHPDTVKCWSLRPLERLLRERDVSDLFPRFGTPDLFDLGLPLLNASTKRVCVVDNPTAADRCRLAAYLRNASHRVHASCLQDVVDEAGCGPDEAP
jgi:hypothetical protein